MEKILISSCLLGQPDRYNGRPVDFHSSWIDQWQREQRVVSFCPELAAGMLTPRPSAEIQGGDGAAVLNGSAHVIEQSGGDVTAVYRCGAQLALQLCQQQGIKLALLNESSPTCGSHTIYDGHFRGQKVAGVGVTVALLQQHGIVVFSQYEIDLLAARLSHD